MSLHKLPIDLLNDLVSNPPKYGVIGAQFSRTTADQSKAAANCTKD